MQATANHTSMIDLIHAIEQFDGSVDPAFDNDLDELEREFAALRLSLPNE
jgi:hypothetical protein